MRHRYQRLLRIYNATDLIYRCELQRIAQLENKLMGIANAEAEERRHTFSVVPYQLHVSRLNFLRIQSLNLNEERNLHIERALRTGRQLKRIGRLLAKSKQFS